MQPKFKVHGHHQDAPRNLQCQAMLVADELALVAVEAFVVVDVAVMMVVVFVAVNVVDGRTMATTSTA